MKSTDRAGRIGVTLTTKKGIFIYSRQLEKFRYPPECPFETDRAGELKKLLDSMSLLTGGGRRVVRQEPAERRVLKKFHSPRYLHVLSRAAKGRWEPEAITMGIGTQDCPVFKDMYDYAVLAAGGTITAADEILAGAADVAFNPSGGFHHAQAEKAAGFCYINDVALACIVLAEAGVRVLYLDVDAHHADGVADAFYERRDVMTISFHEDPRVLFPGTGFVDEVGRGDGRGYCVNVPVPVGTYDEAYMTAFESVAMPLIGAYRPDVIVLQLGADGLAGDPLAHLQLSNNVYADVIEHLLSFHKPILATGGGGYNVENTVWAWALAWSVLSGAEGGQIISNADKGGLEKAGWERGLRDERPAVTEQQRQLVLPAIEAVIDAVRLRVFWIHGL